MMKTIEFTNSFHHTTARVRVQSEDWRPGDEADEGMVRLSRSQIRSVNRKLCGIADCCCGSHQDFQEGLGDDGWCYGGLEIGGTWDATTWPAATH